MSSQFETPDDGNLSRTKLVQLLLTVVVSCSISSQNAISVEIPHDQNLRRTKLVQLLPTVVVSWFGLMVIRYWLLGG